MEKRALVFIDGFNLYHSIDNTRSFHPYKWLDLSRLVQRFLTSSEILSGIRYFTAYTTWNPAKQSRHHAYVTILEQHLGVKVILGQFQEKERKSNVRCEHPCEPSNNGIKCGKKFISHEEKKTDVNIAVEILTSCVKDECDSIYMVSGDNDLIPALEATKELFPSVKIHVILPINSKAKKMMQSCNENGFKYMRVNEGHLRDSQLPEKVVIGSRVYSRPSGWK